MGIDRKIGRLITAGAVAAAVMVPGLARAQAVEPAQPTVFISEECPRGGYGVFTMELMGRSSFPEDVTMLTPDGRMNFSAGQEMGKLTFDLSYPRFDPNPEERAPRVNIYRALPANPTPQDLRNNIMLWVGPTACLP